MEFDQSMSVAGRPRDLRRPIDEMLTSCIDDSIAHSALGPERDLNEMCTNPPISTMGIFRFGEKMWSKHPNSDFKPPESDRGGS